MILVDWNGGRRLQRNQSAKMERESSLFPYQPKAPQEQSDEEMGKIELHLSALGDARGTRPPGMEINGSF